MLMMHQDWFALRLRLMSIPSCFFGLTLFVLSSLKQQWKCELRRIVSMLSASASRSRIFVACCPQKPDNPELDACARPLDHLWIPNHPMQDHKECIWPYLTHLSKSEHSETQPPPRVVTSVSILVCVREATICQTSPSSSPQRLQKHQLRFGGWHLHMHIQGNTNDARPKDCRPPSSHRDSCHTGSIQPRHESSYWDERRIRPQPCLLHSEKCGAISLQPLH
jgi:hypothetical protein